jgi:Tfp pilus assembly protein PilF
VAEYRAALQIDPSNADVHYQLGLALRRLGRASEAAAEFQAARAGAGP